MSRLNDADAIVAQIFKVWGQIDECTASYAFMELMDNSSCLRLASELLSLKRNLYSNYASLVSDRKIVSHLREAFLCVQRLPSVSYDFEHPKFN